MKIKPIGERILLKPVKVEEKTANGIILSASSVKEDSNLGEIVEIGNLEKYSMLQVGMKVFYTRLAGTEVEVEEGKYLLMNAEDVLAIID